MTNTNYIWPEKDINDRWVLAVDTGLYSRSSWRDLAKVMDDTATYLKYRSAYILSKRLTANRGEFAIIFAPGYAEVIDLEDELKDILAGYKFTIKEAIRNGTKRENS